MATAAQLIGLGVPGATAYLLDSNTPQATTAQLMATGVPASLALALGDNFVALPPTVVGLMGLGMAASLASLLASSGGSTTPSQPFFTAARAATLAGTRNTRIGVFGDSTSYGAFALGSLTTGNNRSAGFPTDLANALTSPKGSWQNWFGVCAIDGTNHYPGMDNRLTFPTAGFVASNVSLATYGGCCLHATGTNPAVLAFTPTTPCNAVEVFYETAMGGGVGTCKIDIDGGPSLGTISNAATPANTVISQVFTFALGTHTINITHLSGFTNIAGMAAYNTAVKEISIFNGSIIGAATNDYITATNGQSILNTAANLNLDLVLLGLTINDMLQQINLTTYQANLQTIINGIRATGKTDIIAVTGNAVNPASNAATAQANQDTYVAAYKAVMATNAIQVADVYTSFGPWAVANARGDITDGTHPNAQGYARIAATVLPYIGGA